jgi:hypothetical protein
MSLPHFLRFEVEIGLESNFDTTCGLFSIGCLKRGLGGSKSYAVFELNDTCQSMERLSSSEPCVIGRWN